MIDFKAPSRQLFPLIWGNGHTTETDPILKGWRVKRLKPGSAEFGRRAVALIGRKGKTGCFTAMRVGDNKIEVSIYAGQPEVVARKLADDEELQTVDVRVDNVPGWGLAFIQLIELVQPPQGFLETFRSTWERGWR